MKCIALGYGKSDLNHNSSGKLTQTSLEHVRITLSPTQIIVLYPALGENTLKTWSGDGDSGGPIFCKRPGQDLELIATLNQVWWPAKSKQKNGDAPNRVAYNAVWLHSDPSNLYNLKHP